MSKLKLKLKNFSEINDKDFDDSDYRRGYTQGYFQALSDSDLYGFRKCYSFLNKKLMDWRYKGNLQSFTLPPEIKE